MGAAYRFHKGTSTDGDFNFWSKMGKLEGAVQPELEIEVPENGGGEANTMVPFSLSHTQCSEKHKVEYEVTQLSLIPLSFFFAFISCNKNVLSVSEFDAGSSFGG